METKPFYKTSEFWLSVLTEVGVLVTALADLYPGRWAAIASAVIAGLYAVARGVAKAGVPYTPPKPIAGGSQELDVHPVVKRAKEIHGGVSKR